jgi:hypothetical protein
MKKGKIEFIAETKEMLEVLNRPYPAIDKLPSWFSQTPSYINNKVGVLDGDPTATVKKCMAFFDGMVAGYHIPLHCDVWVENNGPQDLKINWAWDDMEVISAHNKSQYEKYPIPDEYHPIVFKFINPWIIKTPKGWSSLLIHPIHQDGLPFTSLTAVVDTDKHPTPVNFVFLLRKDFSGLIQKGTPFIQVIPFKRQDFKSEFSHDNGFFKREWRKAHSVFFDRYKRFFRTQKIYEQGGEKKCPFAFLKK